VAVVSYSSDDLNFAAFGSVGISGNFLNGHASGNFLHGQEASQRSPRAAPTPPEYHGKRPKLVEFDGLLTMVNIFLS
jgi:hypothetical protein